MIVKRNLEIRSFSSNSKSNHIYPQNLYDEPALQKQINAINSKSLNFMGKSSNQQKKIQKNKKLLNFKAQQKLNFIESYDLSFPTQKQSEHCINNKKAISKQQFQCWNKIMLQKTSVSITTSTTTQSSNKLVYITLQNDNSLKNKTSKSVSTQHFPVNQSINVNRRQLSKFQLSLEKKQLDENNKKIEKNKNLEIKQQLLKSANKTTSSKFLQKQIKEQKESETQINNTIKNLKSDKLIESDDNLKAFEESNIDSSQVLKSGILPQLEQKISKNFNEQENYKQVSSCSLSKKLLSKQFFINVPTADTRVQYYMHYLLHQTLRSSEIRAHAKRNFDQLQYLKLEIFPKLEEFPLKIVNMPKPPHKKNMKTLVLDLDETLVHCVDCIDSCSCINSIHDINLQSSSECSPMLLQLSFRPGLQKFLQKVSEMYEVIIFTASELSYAKKTVEKIDANGYIDGILSREDCIEINYDEFIKDLRCLNREEGSVVIVDNSLGAVKQIEALIPIVPFYGDETDVQLEELLIYLIDLSQADNLIQRNKQLFEWDIFFQSKTYQEYIQTIRKIKRMQLGSEQ